MSGVRVPPPLSVANRESSRGSRALYAVMIDGLRAATPRLLALASFRLESSPSSAIQVDRAFLGGSRSLYVVMSDALRPAIAGLARSRLVAARVESLLRYPGRPRVQRGLAVGLCGYE